MVSYSDMCPRGRLPDLTDIVLPALAFEDVNGAPSEMMGFARVASERADCKPINSENANSWVYAETH
jgi:hypothetical protein